MKKILSWIAIPALLMLAPILAAPDAMAGMVPLTANEMEAVSAQSGIAIHTDGIEYDMRADYIALGDPSPDGSSVFMSLCGVEMKGSVWMRNPLEITTTTGPNAFSDTPVTSVNIRMDGVVMEMERFSVDAIRVGSEPGAGPSFGSLYMKGGRTEISGNISIWAL